MQLCLHICFPRINNTFLSQHVMMLGGGLLCYPVRYPSSLSVLHIAWWIFPLKSVVLILLIYVILCSVIIFSFYQKEKVRPFSPVCFFFKFTWCIFNSLHAYDY